MSTPPVEQEILSIPRQKSEGQPAFWWVAPLQLGVHIIVGTVIFLLILVPAVGIDCLLHWLEGRISNHILLVLSIAKTTVVYLDIGLYLVYVANVCWRFLSSLTWSKGSSQ